ncbi:class III extradiol ring-cleavage dioxygenase [Colwellia sp. E2M01]|uniref:DODA-type extradiol aromatic ring-opening family dioxygenase n=1 Tax=Colwellia sp. E2M01 TaxID=2841561 RepID=UPI001C0A31E7|nr:class III extradiol ring-cleavage dioxygenase [Colwellia sp. E2M01]MBU2870384.1 dioxygenase [Colwellia sp. E2M01]
MKKQPALFISHGSPMMAIVESKTSRFLQKLGKSLTIPKAIVVFSAHFERDNDIVITAGETPKTIHDFYGFPAPLYNIQYNAPGSPELAKKIAERFEQFGLHPMLDEQQGWDHGLWIPLQLMFPAADIPIVQISINSSLGARVNYEYGKLIASLRDENILIIGSGNVTHNLAEFAKPTVGSEKRVKSFTEWVNEMVSGAQTESLLNYMNTAPNALFNHPTQEHFLPIIAVMGASETGKGELIHQDIEHGILAMNAYRFE